MMLLWRYRFMEYTTGGYLWSQWMVVADDETEEDLRDIADSLIGDFGKVLEIETKSQ